MSDTLIKVENVSKRFCRSLKRSLWYGLQDLGSEFNGNYNGAGNGMPQSSENIQLRMDEFWAVKDVSFELRRGECLGLIGRNGAGKTTLLKIINGLIKPDTGRITIAGRVSALIALGAGFNPILSGRENIIVNASVLGLSKNEINNKIDEIIDFAEIRDFIDSPVQNYSSGMAVRLGFAVATALNPDVLILDEVLAVGDAAFRAKCYSRIGELQRDSAVIFVSHSMESVARICDIGAVMKSGNMIYLGDTINAVAKYEEINTPQSGGDEGFCRTSSDIKSFQFEASPQNLQFGQDIECYTTVEAVQNIHSATMRIIVYDYSGNQVAEWGSSINGHSLQFPVGKSTIYMRFPLQLRPGQYKLAVCISPFKGIEMIVWSYKLHSIEIQGNDFGFSPYQIQTSSSSEAFILTNP